MKLVKVAGLVVLSSVASLAILGVFSAQAVETVQHVYLCKKVPIGTGIYEDSHCRVLAGTMEYFKEAEGSTPQKVLTKVSKEFELEFKTTLIKCTSATSTSTESNPEPFKTTPGAGKTKVTFEGCSVVKAPACLPGKKVVTNELKAVLESNEKFTGVKFTPVAGTTLATLPLGEECAVGEELPVTGSAFGVAKNEESALEFTNESSSLVAAGGAAKLRGSMNLQGEVGGVPHNLVEGP